MSGGTLAATFRYVVCDVFTQEPLEGNPLAVFTDARGMPEALLPRLARELHLSETVFCYPAERGGHVRIRIFTPDHELPFAGHPVLGSAFVLAAPLQLPEIVLETGAGLVPVRLERDGPRIVFGRMRQPVPRIAPFPDVPALLGALRVAAPHPGAWLLGVGASRPSSAPCGSRRPCCRSRSTTTAPTTSWSRSPTRPRSRRSARTTRPWPSWCRAAR